MPVVGKEVLVKFLPMKNFLLGALFILLIAFGYQYFDNRSSEREELKESTALIQKQIKNVGKLVVTEGQFSQVFSYSNSRRFYLDVFSARKKALILVNAKVEVAYDLSKMDVEVDEANKKVIIKYIPEQEVNIYPEISYYDVTQDYLNQFKADDHNKIRTRIDDSLREKVNDSEIVTNAQNRLISELQKIYILTSSMGWTLEYNQQTLEGEDAVQSLKL